MNKDTIDIKLDQYEYGAVLTFIYNARKDRIKQGKDIEFLNEILEKMIKAPKKTKHFKRKLQYER